MGDEIEGMLLDPFINAGKDLVGGLNVHDRSSLIWLASLEEKNKKEDYRHWSQILDSKRSLSMQVRIEKLMKRCDLLKFYYEVSCFNS